jgi:hypothetical protein
MARIPQVALAYFALLLSVASADKPIFRDVVHEFQPNIKPSLYVPRLTSQIMVDGRLDDAGWENAARAVNFTEFFPGDGTRPPIHMETLVTYDDTHLYLAFLVEDDPGTIRASLSDRDKIWSDDYVGILLDTYGDANWAYFIFANPFGIQGDARFVAGIGEDDGVDLVFDSEGQITDKGYQVEMAIPYSSLRFPEAEVQTWRATFWITHPRGSRSQYTWAAVDRDNACWMCQWGSLTGMKGIEAGKNIEVLPSMIGSQIGSLNDEDDPAVGFNSGKPGGDIGLGLKYMITPNIVADVALNPDFSQVEADAAQIDVNQTFALFYPERRPFFQEGGDLFRTNRQVVYTRSINDPSVAAKLTGRFGRLNVAYMGARDENTPLILPFEEQSITLATALKSTSNMFRAKQSFGEDAFIGAMITDRRLDGGGSGSLLTTDGRFTFLKNYRFEWKLTASSTTEPDDPSLTTDEDIDDLTFGEDDYSAVLDGDDFWGYGAYVSVDRNAKYYSFDVAYEMRNPTFRADNGFITQNNHHTFKMWQGYTFYPEGKVIDRIYARLWIDRTHNYYGDFKSQHVMPFINLQLKGQTNLFLSTEMSRETFGDKQQEFVGLQNVHFDIGSRFSELIQFQLHFLGGRQLYRDRENPVIGGGYDYNFSVTLKPSRRMVVEPTLSYAELYYPSDPSDFPAGFTIPEDFEGSLEELAGTEIYQGYIFRTRLSYQFTKRLFLRFVLQYDNFDELFDIDPLLTYRINPFSAFYVGSALDYQDFGGDTRIAQTERTYFFKFQYLFSL